ncbi:hypothetical protein B0T17DRAFT_602915 [Bombardia bombarda]|uniref:Uncharacterized protein n=1 Tax=Bombardia bombarda TaxID=252184 RepID=A0AA39TZB9_9PEZI|nr:hypothetical protein B0T17DRAFT_602915 [Bombardia bombarda]
MMSVYAVADVLLSAVHQQSARERFLRGLPRFDFLINSLLQVTYDLYIPGRHFGLILSDLYDGNFALIDGNNNNNNNNNNTVDTIIRNLSIRDANLAPVDFRKGFELLAFLKPEKYMVVALTFCNLIPDDRRLFIYGLSIKPTVQNEKLPCVTHRPRFVSIIDKTASVHNPITVILFASSNQFMFSLEVEISFRLMEWGELRFTSRPGGVLSIDSQVPYDPHDPYQATSLYYKHARLVLAEHPQGPGIRWVVIECGS